MSNDKTVDQLKHENDQLKMNIMETTDILANAKPIVCSPLFPDDYNVDNYNNDVLFRFLESVYSFGLDVNFVSRIVYYGNNARLGGIMYGLVLSGFVKSVDRNDGSALEFFELTEKGIAKMKELYDNSDTIQEYCSICERNSQCSAFNSVLKN